MLSFDITHGPTEAERRNSTLYKEVTARMATRPKVGGRKLLALFEAQNPNGLIARLRASNGSLPTSDPIKEATDFILKYGGEDGVQSWPLVADLYAAINTLEAELGDEAPQSSHVLVSPKGSLTLANVMQTAPNADEMEAIISYRDEVLGRFTPVFQRETIAGLTEEDFRDFLSFDHNHHWTGLERKKNQLCANMDGLRQTLETLLDESQPLARRFDVALSHPGMGKATISAILFVSKPTMYGVWNGPSEIGVKNLGHWPSMPSGASDGAKYEKLCIVLVKLAREHNIHLWELDTRLWSIANHYGMKAPTPVSQGGSSRDLDSRAKSIWEIKHSVLETVKTSNGQKEERKVKNKELSMTEAELEARIEELLAMQGEKCAITGLNFEYVGDGENKRLRPSLDRIDSDGHYEAHNVQLVCRFINFWKQSTPDNEFRELIALVRSEPG